MARYAAFMSGERAGSGSLISATRYGTVAARRATTGSRSSSPEPYGKPSPSRPWASETWATSAAGPSSST